MIAFNNQHKNLSARLRRSTALTGSSQKRHAAIVPNEDEDFAEAVFFTTQGLSDDDASLLSSADPSIYSLAVVCGGPDPVEHAGPATYHIVERNAVIEKGKGFLAWLIANARFTKQKEESSQICGTDTTMVDEESDNHKSQRVALGNGESKVLV